MAAIAVFAVVATGIVLRFVTRSELWLDEALSVNIARLPLSDLGDALEQDGAPPLYYVMLHFWIRVFGHGNLAVRSLSGVLSVATLPVAYFAGRRIGGPTVGPTVGWLTVLVLATSPYAIRFGTESRMYALLMLLVLGGYLALRRALEQPTLPRLALVAGITASLIYTQYWSFYLLAVIGVGLVVVRRMGSAELRSSATAAIAAMGVGFLAFVPWIPIFRYQLAHTGTPWGDARLPWSALADAVARFAGRLDHGEAFILIFLTLILPLLALFGQAIDSRRIELDLRTRPTVRWELAAAFATLLVGLTLSWLNGTAFESRYAAVMYPLFVIAIAFGITVFVDRRTRVVVVALLALLGIAGGVRNVIDHRTQAHLTTAVIRAEAHPGDVVAYCPDQVGPDASRLLEGEVAGLVQLTFPGARPPALVNWVDYIKRIEAADPAPFAQEMVARAGDHTIWFVNAPGYRNVEGKCEAIAAELAALRAPRTRVIPDGDAFFEFQGLIEYRPQ